MDLLHFSHFRLSSPLASTTPSFPRRPNSSVAPSLSNAHPRTVSPTMFSFFRTAEPTASPERGEKAVSVQSSDEQDLARMGYRQEFKREFTNLSVSSISLPCPCPCPRIGHPSVSHALVLFFPSPEEVAPSGRRPGQCAVPERRCVLPFSCEHERRCGRALASLPRRDTEIQY